MTEQEFQRDVDKRLRQLENKVSVMENQQTAMAASLKNQMDAQSLLIDTRLRNIEASLEEDKKTKAWTARAIWSVLILTAGNFIVNGGLIVP